MWDGNVLEFGVKGDCYVICRRWAGFTFKLFRGGGEDEVRDFRRFGFGYVLIVIGDRCEMRVRERRTDALQRFCVCRSSR